MPERRGGSAHAGGTTAVERMLEDVRAGLSLPQKEIPPTYFYDERGSHLFEEITRLPEYYLTRAEHALLEQYADEIVRLASPAALAELGAGTSDKSRVLIEALRRRERHLVYAPIDVSSFAREKTARTLEGEFPGIVVIPVASDLRDPLELPDEIPHPVLWAFLGSTIGNFAPHEAERLLARVRRGMHPEDRFLLGIDLVKDPAVLDGAYNDEGGITADFNLNVLHVINRELGADFDHTAFRHKAFYNAQLHRIEMHLVSLRPQEVHIPSAASFEFDEGETIRTEISCKYERADVEWMFTAGGFALERWISDAQSWFALALGRPLE